MVQWVQLFVVEMLMEWVQLLLFRMPTLVQLLLFFFVQLVLRQHPYLPEMAVVTQGKYPLHLIGILHERLLKHWLTCACIFAAKHHLSACSVGDG